MKTPFPLNEICQRQMKSLRDEILLCKMKSKLCLDAMQTLPEETKVHIL